MSTSVISSSEAGRRGVFERLRYAISEEQLSKKAQNPQRKSEDHWCKGFPHRFRHFFAKNYILSGGDPFTLQKILGHSDMQMLRKYINMFDKDIRLQHHQFSPVQRFKF